MPSSLTAKTLLALVALISLSMIAPLPPATAQLPLPPIQFESTTIPVGLCPAEVTQADLDGDGDLDIIFANHHTHDIRVLTGLGGGAFAPGAILPVPGLDVAHPISITLADFNSDGFLDVATVGHENDEGTRFLGDGIGGWSAPLALPVGLYPLHLDSGDWNEDGTIDLVTSNRDEDTLSLLFGNGDGTFQPHQTIPAGDGPTAVIAADLDGDSHLDLVGVNSFGGTLSIHYGLGTGVFEAPVEIAGFPVASSVIAEDLSGDGVLDLVVTHQDTAQLLLGLPARTYAPPTVLMTGGGPRNVTAADVIGSPALDILLTRPLEDSIAILEGDGLGGFTMAGAIGTGDGPWAISAADFDGDGSTDLVVTNEVGHSATILLHRGLSPMFQRGDENQDGVIDIADPILSLQRLFIIAAVSPFPCHDATDANDDGMPNIADPIFILSLLFSGGDPVPPPAGVCGHDPTADQFGCDSFLLCP